jgi:hypothetical protein
MLPGIVDFGYGGFLYKFLITMAPEAGLEPATLRLTAPFLTFSGLLIIAISCVKGGVKVGLNGSLDIDRVPKRDCRCDERQLVRPLELHVKGSCVVIR